MEDQSREVGVPELWRTGAGRWVYRTEAAARPRTVPRAPDAHGTKSTGGATEPRRQPRTESGRGTPPPSTERNAAAEHGEERRRQRPRLREPDLGAAARRGEDTGVRER
jgi:hypothetical protein